MFSIGEFARCSGVSARMLRHYDKLGLLSPAHIAENGYRHYDEAQLPVLRQIETLKSYGFALSEIAALLLLPQEALAQCIHVRRLEALSELSALRHRIRQMEDAVTQMEGTDMTNKKYHVIVMNAPEQRVFSIRKSINVADTHALFAELHDEMERRGIRRAGATQQRYMGETFSYECMDVEAQAVVAAETQDEHVSTLPVGTFAATTHVGPYAELHNAYHAICAWLTQHPEYEVCGPTIERYLKDEESAVSPEEFETGILFPIRKKA